MFRTKICGVRTPKEAEVVLSAGVDAIGLNFYEPSSRYIQAEARDATIKAIGDRAIKVGLFVNSSVETIRAVAAENELDVIQLHGDENVDFIGQLSELTILKAVRCQEFDRQLIEQVKRLADCSNVAALLLDAYKEGEYGGTGVRLTWQEVPAIVDACPSPIVLAGGLTPDNVAEAILETRVAAVDVASGVEGVDGLKAAGLCQSFVERAIEAFAHLA